MTEKIGFLETKNKDGSIEKSNSRRNATIIILSSLLAVFMLLIFSFIDEGTSVLAGAAAAGTLFITLAGSAMYFSFNQKKTEVENAA